MRISCDRAKFLAAFTVAASVAPRRTPKPIIQNVKLIAKPDGVSLVATDLEVFVRIDVPGVEVAEPGEALLASQRFGSLLRESADERLTVAFEGISEVARDLVVTGGYSRFKLAAANPSEFPTCPAFAESAYYELPASALRDAIRQTVFATCTESTHYALGGVLLEFDGAYMIAVGSDGRRLAKSTHPAVSVGAPTHCVAIVPARATQLLVRALADAEGTVKVAITASHLLMHGSGVTLQAQQLEGRFPNWRAVLPQDRQSSRFEAGIAPFLSALRQAAITASEESCGITFSLQAGCLMLACATAEVGQSRIELPVAYDGPPVAVCLNHEYVSDFLRAAGSAAETFTFDAVGSESAVLLSAGADYQYVVMPLTSGS